MDRREGVCPPALTVRTLSSLDYGQSTSRNDTKGGIRYNFFLHMLFDTQMGVFMGGILGQKGSPVSLSETQHFIWVLTLVLINNESHFL